MAAYTKLNERQFKSGPFIRQTQNIDASVVFSKGWFSSMRLKKKNEEITVIQMRKLAILAIQMISETKIKPALEIHC